MNKKTILTFAGVGLVLSSIFKKTKVAVNVSNNNANNNTNNTNVISGEASRFVDTSKPRGIRNHNPGNIKRTGEKWQGMSANQYDAVFIVFDSSFYGLRALAKLLKNYERKYKIDTCAKLIRRYSATDQSAYTNNLARALSVSANQKISISANLQKIMQAIIKQENGYNPYSPHEIAVAIAAA